MKFTSTYFPPDKNSMFAFGPVFPFGWMNIEISTRNMKASVDYALPYHEVDQPGAVDTFRRELVDLEAQLARAIENVRTMMEALPAQSIESAPSESLFAEINPKDAINAAGF